MIRRMARVLQFGTLLLMCVGVSVWGGNTYLNNFPNVEVTEPDCYEFDITVSQGSGSSATLTLRVYDVDEESGELDEVYLNGTYLGYLSGTNDTWSTTSFNITNVVIYGAANTIRICVDPGGGEDTTWRAELDWGQILIDGGSAEDADIASISASGEWNAIQVQTNVSATNTDVYRLEINLLDSTNNNKDISVDTFSLTGGSSTTRFNTVSLPSEPSSGEVFTIEANLFNDTTGVQQAVKTTTWTSASEPPTDIVLSHSTVDENLPALTLVGMLSAIDSDSTSHDFTLIGGDIASFSISGTQLLTALSFDYESREEYSLQIGAEDDDGNTTSKWFTISIDDVNEAPLGTNDEGTVAEGNSIVIDVLANDSDPDGDGLAIDSVSVPSKGTALVLPDDTIQYTPDDGACGSDAFTYAVTDGRGEEDIATVSVTISNTSPTAVDDEGTTQEDTAVLIDALANDSDAGEGNLTLQSVSTPMHGSARIQGDLIQYTPSPRYEGKDRFSYALSDPCGATSTGWVEIVVIHTNHPPSAHAGGFYQGIVGEPLTLDASFSHDPDIEDTLQYRWDLNGSGIPNTPWLSSPIYETTYTDPFIGQLVLEVRDLYRGIPTGEIARASALVRIASIQSIQVYVFEDLDGDGSRSPEEPGISGVELDIGGDRLQTEADGGISLDLDAGSWEILVPPAAVSLLEARGFAVTETEATVNLGVNAIEIVNIAIVKTSTRLKGTVFSDSNANGKLDDDDRRVEGVIVVLDGNMAGAVVADETGAFAFRNVPFGDHVIYVEAPGGENSPLSLLVPFTLSRIEKPHLDIMWPFGLGPESGFLRVDVEKGQGGTP